MKKLFYLLFLLPLAFLGSCNNDDDVPQVDLTLTLDGVTQNPDNEQFYIVNGTEASVQSLVAESLTDKAAVCTNCVFYIDGLQITDTFIEPFASDIPTAILSPGLHYLQARTTILQVDKSIAVGYISIPIQVVASADDLPAGLPALGTYSVTMRMQKSK